MLVNHNCQTVNKIPLKGFIKGRAENWKVLFVIEEWNNAGFDSQIPVMLGTKFLEWLVTFGKEILCRTLLQNMDLLYVIKPCIVHGLSKEKFFSEILSTELSLEL